jgi:hypothetical protein
MGLTRVLLLAILGYLLWRILRVVVRMMERPRSAEHEDIGGQKNAQNSSTPYKDIKDAEFQDLPPTNKQNDNAAH